MQNFNSVAQTVLPIATNWLMKTKNVRVDQAFSNTVSCCIFSRSDMLDHTLNTANPFRNTLHIKLSYPQYLRYKKRPFTPSAG